MKQYFTSDTHFYHNKYKTEGWEERYWKKYDKIKEPFVLYHLGDFSMKQNNETLKKLLDRYRENRYLMNMVIVLGNHDEKYTKFLNYSVIACSIISFKYKGYDVHLTHEPLDVGFYYKSINIHGHFHHLDRDDRMYDFDHRNNILIEEEELIEIDSIFKRYEKEANK